MNHYRRFISNSFNQDVMWNVASLGILALSGVVMSLIIIRFKGNEALGIFNQVYAIYIILSQIGVGGLQHSTLKHISYHQDDPACCADITTSALILVTAFSIPMGIGCAVLAHPVGDLLDSPSIGKGLLFVIPGLVFFALNKVLINTINGLQHMRAYAVFRSLRFILIPLIISIIALSDLPASYLALSLTISEAVLFIGLSGFVYLRLLPLKLISARRFFSEHLSFGARGFLSGVLTELNTRIDVLMLGYFTTDAQVGIYSFAATLAEGFSQFPLALRWNIDPVIGRYFAEGNKQKISELSRKIRRGFYPIVALATGAAVVFYPVFLGLWLPDNGITAGWIVFTVIMIGVGINAGYRPFMGILLQGGRPGTYTFFITSLVLGDALLNLLFIPLLGIYGAAIVTMFTYLFEAAGLILYTRKLFGIKL